MKFKVGDKVKVRKDLENGYYSVGKLEDYQNDKVFTIKQGIENNKKEIVYKLLEDKINYNFIEEMLISAEEEITLKGTFVKEEDNKKVYKLNLDKLEWENFYNIDDDLYLCIKKEEILDEKEKEYLRAVIRPFRDRVKYITKIKGCMKNEYIAIYIKSINESESGERVPLPYFKKNTMYKGMEQSKKYTLEELGL